MDGGCRTRWTPERRPGAGVPGGSRQAMDRAMTSSRLLPGASPSRPRLGASPAPADAFAVSMGALLDGAPAPAVDRAAGERAGAGQAGRSAPQLPATAATQLERAREGRERGQRLATAAFALIAVAFAVAAAIAGARGWPPTRLTDQRSSAARTASITWSTPLRRKTSGSLMRATPSRSSEPSSLTAIPVPASVRTSSPSSSVGEGRPALTAWDRAVCRAWRSEVAAGRRPRRAPVR